ncbi:MAG: hypothetical protein JW731_09985, partial [Bacteroidales bacterium]|nr:hypothetical protein [Bacteroidales bacterium]
MCKFTKLLSVAMVLVLSSTLLFGQALKLDEQRTLQMKQEALKSDIVPGVHALGDLQLTDFDYTKLASSDGTKAVLYDNGPLIT